MNDSIRTALIYGSTREGRFCDTIGRWAAGQIAANDGFSLDIIDPAEVHVKPGHEGEDAPARLTLHQRIARAEAFVVVTPEYNHGYPAPLKSLIDSVGVEWHAKPVAFVSYGGISGGLRAVEQLRQVFAELHAVTVRDAVSFAGAWQLFNPEGKLVEPQRSERSMQKMLGQLHWWASALRKARRENPYTQAA